MIIPEFTYSMLITSLHFYIICFSAIPREFCENAQIRVISFFYDYLKRKYNGSFFSGCVIFPLMSDLGTKTINPTKYQDQIWMHFCYLSMWLSSENKKDWYQVSIIVFFPWAKSLFLRCISGQINPQLILPNTIRMHFLTVNITGIGKEKRKS